MRVLVLGGTGEASLLAQTLTADARFEATLSLAGATRAPVLPAGAHRIGGFGGVDGLCAWLHAHAITMLVDATHPYAVQMRGHAVMAAGRLAIPLLRIARPAWQAQDGDRWLRVADAAAAASCLGPVPRRVLLTVGAKSLAPFRDAPLHRYVIRCIDPPDAALLPHGAELLLARGPFVLAGELDLLDAWRIEVLVSKNSGGSATAAKLQAARLRGLQVVLIERPPEPGGGASVSTAAQAMHWLSALHHDRLRKVTLANAPIQDPRAAKQT